MKNNKEKKFGFARAFVVFWLGILGIGYFANTSFLGILFFLAMLYVIFMDPINDRLSSGKQEKEAIETSVYNPSEHGELAACPYCGKDIPMDINYCYFCGRSLEAFKKIEAVRADSLKQIDDSLLGVGKGAYRDKIKEIKGLIDGILKEYEENPTEHDSYSKFMSYYLPKTLSVIEHYHALCTANKLDSNQSKIKTQLEESLDMIAEAFANILSKATTEGIDDVSADASVLEAILKQDGLTDSDFPV